MGLVVRVLAAGLVAIIVQLALYPRLQTEQHGDPEPISCDVQGHDDAVLRFARFLQFPTISNSSAEGHISPHRRQAFEDALAYLASTYETVWTKAKVERLGTDNYSLLVTWSGTDPELLPILFISHYDVVPVTEGTEQAWTYGPFSGAVEEGHIWGRGALDIKFQVSVLLEVLTQLIEEGFTPKRTVYFAFGHDEEVGGTQGAAKMAALLASRGVQLEVILDEGGAIMSDGMSPLTKIPVAIVSTSEKVYSLVQVTVESPGGHSSLPPVDGSDVAAQISRLIHHVQANPFPVSLMSPTTDLLHSLAPYTSNAVLRFILERCDVWPVNWLVSKVLLRNRETAAQLRTTVAVTRISAGVANNVLPQQGSVVFNMRSHPLGPNHDQVLHYFNDAIKKIGAVGTATLTNSSYFGPTPLVADYQGPHFKAVKQAIQEIWRHNDQAIAVAPMLMFGGTDSKHYGDLTKHGVLRFSAYQLNKTAGHLNRIHGTNERVAVDDFKRALCTNKRIIELLTEKL